MNGHSIVCACIHIVCLCVNWIQQTMLFHFPDNCVTIEVVTAAVAMTLPEESPHTACSHCLCVHWVHGNTVHPNESTSCSIAAAMHVHVVTSRWLFTVFMHRIRTSKSVCYSHFVWKGSHSYTVNARKCTNEGLQHWPQQQLRSAKG